ncbi:glycoside hydrolase family 128 protein [Laetiporus sulphureus 93-53]|uniref:Glycoside hydrolase family 128 protein n=1 Tax=Laetiporus sulphureus 93-53 TaxID=1314785 RepID=A0A165IF41_9APHY|nr:glycoside hydrolase family 128 protein [Laetiporus sulphureus 93-53]KZT12986.1 glycoside hydrolase family 128 protein [Laetiporus sulphureus 93-53]
MAAPKFINLMAIASLALYVCCLTPSSVNALSGVGRNPHLSRNVAHDGVAKRRMTKKRSNTKRCLPRSSSGAVTSSAVDTASASYSSTLESSASSYEVSSATTYSSTTSDAPTSTYTPTTSDAPTSTYTPTSSSSSASVATSTAVSTGSYSGKTGIAWNNADASLLVNFKTDATKYLYNWSPYKPDNADSLGFDFWAMLPNEESIAAFQQYVVAGYGSTILAFNEPDQAGQANMDPSTAASLWLQYIEPKKDEGFRLISPAVSSGSDGIPWLESFMSACDTCTIDGCALHYYGTDAEDFISYVEQFHSTFPSCPLHVTEYADENFSDGAQADESEIWAFYYMVVPWMDSQSYIESYFQFGVLEDMSGVNTLNALMSSAGIATSLGDVYINDNWS